MLPRPGAGLDRHGRLKLDDPLGMHLNGEERALLAGDGYDLEAITLRHVLSHTAGLADHSDGPTYPERVLAEPQHRWTRHEVLGLCVELFDPVGLLDYRRLGLARTWWETLELAPASAGPRAHQYLGEVDCTDFHPSFDLYGGGGLVCDARDLAIFMRALLAGRVLHDQATLAAMTGSGTPPYRLGLMCVELDGFLAWGHQGFWNTFAFDVPSLDVTVAGAILDHDAVNGRRLADALVATVAARLSVDEAPGR